MFLETTNYYIGLFHFSRPLTLSVYLAFQEVILEDSQDIAFYRLIGFYIQQKKIIRPMTPLDCNEAIAYFPQLMPYIQSRDCWDNLLLNKNLPLSPINGIDITMPYTNLHWFIHHPLFFIGDNYIYEGTPLERSTIRGPLADCYFLFQLVILESFNNQDLFYRLSHYYNKKTGTMQVFDAATSNQIITNLPAFKQPFIYIKDYEGFIVINKCNYNYLNLQSDEPDEYDDYQDGRDFLKSVITLVPGKNDFPKVPLETVNFILAEISKATKHSQTSTEDFVPQASNSKGFFQQNSAKQASELSPPEKKHKV